MLHTDKYTNLDIYAKLPIIVVESTDQPEDGDRPKALEFPKPSFRLAENLAYKTRTKHLKKESYYHYTEPSTEDLMNRVEYDMDEEDIEWLKKLNSKFAETYSGYQVSEDDFERIMDRLEKQSYFESKKSGKEVVLPVDEDATCAICDDGQSQETNMILFCDMCNLAVHQECYGVPYVPEGQWHCRRCLQSPSRNVECVLCPNKGGAFKQTSDNRWCHVICALWIPEVCFANTVFLEPIDNIDQIPQARWKLVCYICKQKKAGACIQCHKQSCYVPFHVTCAQQANLSMKIQTHRYETDDGPLTDVIKKAYCDAHCPTPKNGDRGGMYSGDDDSETDIDDPAYVKWRKCRREKMRQTRKILAEKRQLAFNPISEPVVVEEKLIEISQLLTIDKDTKNRLSTSTGKDLVEDLRNEFIRNMNGYWLLKRRNRNGVPLLRRLQVSYSNSSSKSPVPVEKISAYEQFRYDLESARMLMGECKKREVLKKKMFALTRHIVELEFDRMDLSKKSSKQSPSTIKEINEKSGR